MFSLYVLFVAFLAYTQRSDASLPIAFTGGYAPYHFAPHYPYVGAIAAPAPVMHSAVPAYSSVVPYPVVPPVYPHHRELHNVAGAIQREKELLTDVSLRFPAKKERLAKHKNLEKN